MVTASTVKPEATRQADVHDTKKKGRERRAGLLNCFSLSRRARSPDPARAKRVLGESRGKRESGQRRAT
jgi:hypothetical protein